MSTNRMWLEHVDTGERVLLAKFFSDQWYAWGGVEGTLDTAFDNARVDGRVYRDGVPATVNTYRIVYDHGDAP
jgi:hypothetical protein